MMLDWIKKTGLSKSAMECALVSHKLLSELNFHIGKYF